jgi:hypothetical protein
MTSSSSLPAPGELSLFDSVSSATPVLEEIADAMRILSGGMTMGEDGETIVAPGENDPLDLTKAKPPAGNAQERWQNGMLKKHEVAKARGAFTDFRVKAFDLSDAKDAEEFAEMLNQAGAVGSDHMIEVNETVTMVDRHAPRGFRAVAVVKFFRMVKQMPPSENGPNYEVAPQLKL